MNSSCVKPKSEIPLAQTQILPSLSQEMLPVCVYHELFPQMSFSRHKYSYIPSALPGMYGYGEGDICELSTCRRVLVRLDLHGDLQASESAHSYLQEILVLAGESSAALTRRLLSFCKYAKR